MYFCNCKQVKYADCFFKDLNTKYLWINPVFFYFRTIPNFDLNVEIKRNYVYI
jgi:hypothetical protein